MCQLLKYGNLSWVGFFFIFLQTFFSHRMLCDNTNCQQSIDVSRERQNYLLRFTASAFCLPPLPPPTVGCQMLLQHQQSPNIEPRAPFYDTAHEPQRLFLSQAPILGAGNKITLLHMFILQPYVCVCVCECVCACAWMCAVEDETPHSCWCLKTTPPFKEKSQIYSKPTAHLPATPTA